RCREADGALAIASQIRCLSAHHQTEFRIALAGGGEEIQEVPLRHQRDELAARRQVGEVADPEALVAELALDVLDLLVRLLEELVQQAELAENVHGGWMDGVAAEVAEEVGVLLQHDDVDAGARQQEAGHHAGRAAAGDHAGAGEGLGQNGSPDQSFSVQRLTARNGRRVTTTHLSSSAMPPPGTYMDTHGFIP